MSRRGQIQLSDEEVRKFLDQSRTLILCSNGKDGVPHPMPMWFVPDDDGTLLMTTFRKSQKVKNLIRDPRVSLLVESGEHYADLKGVVLYGRVEIDPDTEHVLDVLERVGPRYGTGGGGGDRQAVRGMLRGQAQKRVVLRLRPERVVSWDHAKLGGVY